MNDPRIKISPRDIITVIVYIVLVPFLPLLVSQRWDWYEAWVFAIICIVGFAVSRLIVAWHSPDLIAERARFTQHENIKPWDRILAPLVGLGAVLIPLAAGLEVLSGGSAGFSVPTKVLAFLVIVAGYSLGSYALYENRFFSGVVRIQADRGQKVISEGPYRWMRHPGYAGALATYLAVPFFLDSLWAVVPALLWAIVLVIRTCLEDQALQDELDGYKDYSQMVRYRLVPGIW